MSLRFITRYYKLPAYVVIVSSMILFITIIGVVWAAPMDDWNDGHLAPTFAILSHKYRLYVNLGPGPVLSTIYPPIGYLAFLPAAIASSPTKAVLIAAAVSAFIYIAPLVFVASELVIQGFFDANRAMAAVVLSVLMGLVYTREIFGEIHANVPGVGLVMMGAWALLYGRRFPERGVLLGSLFLSASIWAYQQTVPGLALGFLTCWLMFGRRMAVRFAIMSICCCLIFFGVFWLTFGGGDMIFNIWTLPKSHPWVANATDSRDPDTWIYSGQWGERIKSIGYLLEKMWSGSALVWTLAGSLLVYVWKKGGAMPRAGSFAPICLLFSLGLALLPTTTLGAVKVGGSTVSYEIALYFIIAAASYGLVEGVSLSPNRGETIGFRHYVAVTALVVFSLAALPMWGIYFKRGREPWSSTTEKAYRYLRTHPGQVYFPAHPLCHLMANNELTHLEAGILDREMGSFPLTPSAFEAGCPASFSFVSFRTVDFHESMLKHFILAPVNPPPELADWRMFKVISETSPPARLH